MPHFKFFKKKNTHNTLGRMNNNNNTTTAATNTTTTSHDGINAGGLPTNIDVRSVGKNDGKEKKNWKNILLRLHQTILSDTTICCSIRKNQRKRNKNINSQDVNNVCMDDEIKMDHVNDDDKENNLNNENNNLVKEIIINDNNIDDNIIEEDSRDLDIESSSKSINIDQIQSIKQDFSENLVKKPSSRFISISNTKNIDSLNISRDDEFDLYDKSKMTLIEKCATIPRRSSETEVLIKKGRFTIIREANNNNYSISRSGESNKSLPSSYSSCSSSCSSLPVSLFESPDFFKGSTKIRKNNDHLLLTSFHSNSPLSSISPYFSNSQMCSSPLSSSFTFHSENNNKNPRRASDSVAHHYKISSQHDNISNNKQLSIIPLQRSHIIHQHSPTSSPHTSPNTTPTSTLVSPLSKSFSSTSTIIKPNNTQSNTHSNQSNRDSNSYPDTPHSTTSTISTTTSIVSTPSGRIFELEGSYFPNNSVSPSSSGSNNNNLSSKRRRKFIIETFE